MRFLSIRKAAVGGLFVLIAITAALGSFAGGSSADPGRQVTTRSTSVLVKSNSTFKGDVRHLPQGHFRAKPERTEGVPPAGYLQPSTQAAPIGSGKASAAISAPAPSAITSFDGLHYTEDCNGAQCGQGHPPDTNGDVGPTYYVQTINVAVGMYRKSDGVRVAAFTLDSLR